jgi:hypothetical protein
MKTDWYRTRQSGTYLVVNAGSSKALALADSQVLVLLAGHDEGPLARDVDSHSISQVIGVLGIDDCLKLRGYCIVRSSVLLEHLAASRPVPTSDVDAVRGSESG